MNGDLTSSKPWWLSRRWFALLLVAAIATAVSLAFANWPRPSPLSKSDTSDVGRSPISPELKAELEQIPDPGLVKPLEAEEAQRINAERPVDARPDSPAAAFRLRLADKTNYASALECLTQAIYYEAAGEGLDGQRAVAQVVLNRVRHPAYPSSICATVYEGSERITSCQFTFTCDGSLARRPIRSLWRQAEGVARKALAGFVFAPVGHSTHYHADYVVPYWAASLDKKIQLGRHIFYRFRGGLGSSRTFNQRYSGGESIPTAKADIAAALEALTGEEVTLSEPDPLAHLSQDVVAPIVPPKQLSEDRKGGKLVIDSDRAPGTLIGSSPSCLKADQGSQSGETKDGGC